MPLQATSGAASYDAFGGGVPVVPNYIEDVFSTYLYTNNGGAITINNGIDLSGKGGLLWEKQRNGTGVNQLVNSATGASKYLVSNSTDSEQNGSGVTFTSTGFSYTAGWNGSMASWTFRKQPKFFDVVTYTGNGTAGRTVSHNLGSVPGCIIVKSTDVSGFWRVYHRSIGNTGGLSLSQTTSTATTATYWNNTSPTSTEFTLGDATAVNGNGGSFVAYLFAHDAGGFGLTGTDNVISCGSYTGNGGLNPINLGYEAQWVMVKNITTGGTISNWQILDNMRGFANNGTDQPQLRANTSDAESSSAQLFASSTGFTLNDGSSRVNGGGETYIYIAIRRGPMKVPTSGTSVFSPTTNAGTGSTKFITTNFPVDLTIQSNRNDVISHFTDRLRGGGANASPRVYSQFTDAETNASAGRGINFDSNTGVTNLLTYNNGVGDNFIYYAMARAPSFFDEVCYTGTGSATTVTHNLGAVPELIIVKRRDTTGAWDSYSSALANTEYVVLNTTAAKATGTTRWNSTTPTSSVFSVGTSTTTNASAGTYVAYLFATCAGVSKVGSYTGTATTKQIDCGFTGGARFVLIKKTSGTGSWYVWDSARGIVSGNDPYLLLNSYAAEVTNTDYIDTYSAGFEISSTAPSEINENGGSFIFLAIA